MTIEKSAEEYLKDKKASGYCLKTVNEHQGKLRRFFKWLGASYPAVEKPEEITREMLSEYQMDLYTAISRRGKRLSINSQHKGMSVVIRWLEWLVFAGRILINPGVTIRLPSEPARLPRNYLSVREMRKLLSVPDLSTHLGVRNRAVLEVLYSTGIRAGELRKLKLEHLNLEEGWLMVVQGKGGKDRVVPLGKAAIHYVSEYIEKSRCTLLYGKDHSYVFVGRYGCPISHSGMNGFVKATAKAAGIKRNITPHILRHTCATLMLKGKADIRYIQELLGHKSLSSTQIYTRVEISDLKKVHTKCHPREQDSIASK